MSTTSEQTQIAQLIERVNKLEDREAIHTVLYKYARGADRCDMKLFKSCYWDDATDFHWFFNGNAHKLADWVIPVLAEIPNSQHSITNPIIDWEGDRAFVESQWYVVHRIPLDEKRIIDQQIEGRYVDVFEKRDGVWKIFHRRVAVEGWREHITFPTPPSPADARRFPNDSVYLGSKGLLEEVAPNMQGFDLWEDARSRHR